MGAIFQSLGRTVAAGVVLLVVFLVIAGVGTGNWAPVQQHAWWAFFFRWLHVLSGVMWIGLLWYFNFVQTPSMPTLPDDQKPAVSKVIAPTALLWFRWSAMSTIVTGIIVASMLGYIGKPRTLQNGSHAIGLGMWLGAIMWFNVWFVIWPNQKKALGIVQVAPEAKAAAAKRAGLASRINTMLSIPMLFCMVAQQNGGF